MGFRLGLDVGTNSIGWALLEVDRDGKAIGLKDLGVRIFPDGRNEKRESLAKDRRLARGDRRRRDRTHRRRDDLMTTLIDLGLMPADKAERKALEQLDPYCLRWRGLDEAISPHDLGRALFHIHQRRGFKSNLKTDRSNSESGKIKQGRQALKALLEQTESRTVGEFLARRIESGESTRARLNGQGSKAFYEFYFDRALSEAEVDALWTSQSRFHPNLTEDGLKRVKAVMFRQRPLKPVVPGKCALIPSEPRAPKALLESERFRILCDLAHLRIRGDDNRDRPLTFEQRDDLLEILDAGSDLKFDKVRKLLKLGRYDRFNLESDKRDALIGNKTARLLSHKDRFGKDWAKLPHEVQAEVVDWLLESESEDDLIESLGARFDLSPEQAEKIALTPLEDGYGRLGRTALSKLIPALERQINPHTGEVYDAPISYAEAAMSEDLHPSDMRPEGGLPHLPHYGKALERHVTGTGEATAKADERYGRLPNPTVHIALNQVRRLVNAITDVYGKPDAVVVELSRDLKNSEDEKKKIAKDQADNQKKNEERAKELKALGVSANGLNLLKMRLWEEINSDPKQRCCVYTGKVIEISDLFGGSIAIDHILPYSRTLDNSAANKVVCYANAVKANRSPWEAFGKSSDPQFNWQDIEARAARLPANKRWRFSEEAMKRFDDKDFSDIGLTEDERKDLSSGFLARHLVDGQYTARLTREYLLHLYPKAEQSRVRTTPGHLTAMIRGKLGLNRLLSTHNQPGGEDPSPDEPTTKGLARAKKNRADHRHHTIDAVVIALTTPALVQEVSRLSARNEDNGGRSFDDFEERWPGFHQDLRRRLSTMVVSHKPNHRAQGKILDGTAYGLLPETDPAQKEGYNLVYRKPFLSLTDKEVDRIRDEGLRRKVKALWAECGNLQEALVHLAGKGVGGSSDGVRRVRLLKVGNAVVTIPRQSETPTKAYEPSDNHRVEIFETVDGKWLGEGVSRFDANQEGFESHWTTEYPGARPVMTLHKGDMLELEIDGVRRVVKVQSIQTSAKRVLIVAPEEGGNFDKRNKDPNDPFGWNGWRLCSFSRMKEAGAVPVHVDVLGRVHRTLPGGRDK